MEEMTLCSLPKKLQQHNPAKKKEKSIPDCAAWSESVEVFRK